MTIGLELDEGPQVADDVASDLPLGRVKPEHVLALARGLEALAGLLRARYGMVPGEIDDMGDSGGR